FPSASVSLNNPDAVVHIAVSKSSGENKPLPGRSSEKRFYSYRRYSQGYEWSSSGRKGRVVLALKSPSFQGVSFGLYGLLQEKLGFKFYHPKRTIIPFRKQWPLPANFQWEAFPRFARKGFHIHTLHPVELTEQLHDPDYPEAAEDLREYIDWLARNQQDTVQFYLLRHIDRSLWTSHAADLVEYAHKRGVEAGVEFSLFMIQQEAFQTIKLLRFFPSYTDQIDSTLSWLFRVKWDFVTVDFSMGEYLPDLGKLMPGLKTHLIRQVTERYKTRMMIPTHVIDSQYWCRTDPSGPGEEVLKEGYPKTGILIHTVMFYALDEPSAPAYGNINFHGMLCRAIQENKRRETWYWPESAYWVSFDNSVPMLLLPYLDARYSDMETMERIGVDSHLTFSSGWEWGYWLVDWSIARWSWNYNENGTVRTTSPLSLLNDLFADPGMYVLFQRALALQNFYFKDRGLIGFMSALDPSAELPWPFNMPFQPRPFFPNSWLLYKASDAEAENVAASVVSGLESYALEMNAVVRGLQLETERLYSGRKQVSPEVPLIARELTRALEVTALRAQHRSLTIRALLAQRKGHWWLPATKEAEGLLRQAAGVRLQALALVGQQEKIYRYPVSLIARQRKNFTAYNFGYLYPASDLFFWRREEEQVRHRRFDAFYMNIWDFLRIGGVKSFFP
ncbi:MAG TPA: hypothetical protein VEJ88_08055, partial [Dissulfurispiraceae bacterium]|nr:hypothetical protein [Dissulfurispiraceae bacterium]